MGLLGFKSSNRLSRPFLLPFSWVFHELFSHIRGASRPSHGGAREGPQGGLLERVSAQYSHMQIWGAIARPGHRVVRGGALHIITQEKPLKGDFRRGTTNFLRKSFLLFQSYDLFFWWVGTESENILWTLFRLNSWFNSIGKWLLRSVFGFRLRKSNVRTPPFRVRDSETVLQRKENLFDCFWCTE